MNTEVLFENKNNKLVITLNKDVSYVEIKEKLSKILSSSDTLFEIPSVLPPILRAAPASLLFYPEALRKSVSAHFPDFLRYVLQLQTPLPVV